MLSDSRIARRHAEIRTEGGRYWIEDLGSEIGTFVNGQKIDGMVQLQNADVITLGGQQLEFLDGDSVTVLLTELPRFDLEGTVVVPADELLAGVHAHQEFIGDRVGRSGRTQKQREMSTALRDADKALALSDDRPAGDLLELLLDLVLESTRADRGVVMLVDDGELMARAARTTNDWEVRISRALANRVVGEKVSTLSHIVYPLHQLGALSSSIRTVMCVPLWSGGPVDGLIYVDSLIRTSSFGQDGLTLLTSLANLAATRLEDVS